MYKVTVPLAVEELFERGRDDALKIVEMLGAERVILAMARIESNSESYEKKLELLRDHVEFFKSKGYEVGAWTLSFYFAEKTNYMKMCNLDGEIRECSACPSDDDFVDFMRSYIKKMASTGVSVILFDDDFRYGCQADQPHCVCDNHLRIICDAVGEELTRAELKEKILSGGKNKYRDAFLKANGDAFRKYAKALREAVDEVAPEVRLCLCLGPSSWDIDGMEGAELVKLLAGNTKPIARLFGAPYLVYPNKHWGFELSDIIELERMECAWMKDDGIEFMVEGDPHPRPRYQNPSANLEGLDTAMRAAGCADGILKYGVDFRTAHGFETGYGRFAVRNRKIYSEIDKYFSNKSSVGIRVYEPMKKVADMNMSTTINPTPNIQIDHMVFPKSSRILSNNTIPTTYEGSGVVGIVFDESARSIPLEALDNGMILDIQAAEILTERGVDVGVRDFGNAGVALGEVFYESLKETFLDYGITTCTHGNFSCYTIQIDEKAEMISTTVIDGKVYPVTFRYENEKGQRFFVYNLNTRIMQDREFRGYARTSQVAEQTEWLSRGKKLPAYCYGNPQMYMQCKEGEDGSLAVGLWNFFNDVAVEPVVELAKPYKKIKFINCKGKLRADKVYLTDIQPYAFAGFEVK